MSAAPNADLASLADNLPSEGAPVFSLRASRDCAAPAAHGSGEV